MCVIAVQTIGAKISDERIRQLYASNPDGAGIMWAQDGKVHWRKGFFSVERLLDAWHRIPKGVTAAVHCRITTHGGTCDRLCHPFPLTNKPNEVFKLKGKAKVALMHNGIMHFMERDCHYNAKRDSDSSAYAKKLYDMLGGARLPSHDEEMDEIRDETSGSKIFLLDGTGAFFTAGEWTWEDGVLYSNTNFKWRSNYYYGNNFYTRGTGFQGYPKQYDYKPAKKEEKKEVAAKTSGNSFYYNGMWDDEDDDAYYYNKYGSKSYADLHEDDPTKSVSVPSRPMSQREIEDYAEKQDKYPLDYFGEARWVATGERVIGMIRDDLYVDLSDNVYELDEDTLTFTLRKDIYLEEYRCETSKLLTEEDERYLDDVVAVGANS